MNYIGNPQRFPFLSFFRNLIPLILFTTLYSSCKKSGDDPPVNNPTTQQDIAAVDNAVSSLLSTYKVPGASLAISKNGKLVYVKGYGKANTATGELVTPSHRFRLASVSKTHTAVAILKLAQEGRLNIDAKVFGTGGVLANDFGTGPYNANLSAITVKHLLHHTAGSWGASTGGDVIDQNPSYTYKQLFDWIINTRPNPKVPGTQYDYTNVGYSLLGRIIEKISGKTYTAYVQEMLSTLNDANTDITGKTEGEKKSNEVKYYGQGNDVPFVYTMAFPRRDADGGLITTAKDLLKFVNAIDGFNTRPDILNSASITTLSTGSTVFSSYACGIGIWSAENLWYNYGSLPGTRTGFMRHNNGTSVALLLNSRADPSAGDNAFVQAMQSVMLDLIKNPGYKWQDIDQF